jgi:hypothetical protein
MNSQESSGTWRDPNMRSGFTPAWANRRRKNHRELRQPPQTLDSTEAQQDNLSGLNAYLMRMWGEDDRK